MNFFRARPAYPKDRDLARVIQAAASRLAAKLDRLDPDSLDVSEETRGVLRRSGAVLKHEIERAAHVYAWALPRDEKPFSRLALVAYGDVLGFASLLARECSVGTVVCHNTKNADNDEARAIGKAIGSPADHYVFGDLEDLEFVMIRRAIPCDVFVSRGSSSYSSEFARFFDGVACSSSGTISCAISVEQESRSNSNRAGPTRSLDRFRIAMVHSGFQVSIVRGPSTSTLSGAAVGRSPSLVLCGSRSPGKRAALGETDAPGVRHSPVESDKALSIHK
jgi:hypothetical protein